MLLRLAAPSADAHARRHRLLVHVQSAATLKLLFHGPPPAFASPPSVGASWVDSARRAQPATMRGAERSRVTLNPGLPVPSSGDVARTTATGMISQFSCCEGEPLAHDHWITWSARSSSDCGIVRPSAFAVFRLITNSNFVGCSTGRSAGFAPLKILST